MTGSEGEPAAPPAFCLEYRAFCDAHRAGYLRYAQARIEDRHAARDCVDAVLDGVGACWPTLLGSARPAARVWTDLRCAMDHRTAAAHAASGRFHAVLRSDQADIMVLHHGLDMPVGQAAGLMGLPDHEAHALLRGAERELKRLPDR